MDELTFILILAGISVVLLVAMFTYYKHHKTINDEIQGFNNHVDDIDDVLLNETGRSNFSHSDHKLKDSELPESFTASRNEKFDIDLDFKSDKIEHIHDKKDTEEETKADTHDLSQNIPIETTEDSERELVDGVYINSKRVIKTNQTPPLNQNKNAPIKKTSQQIKVVYDPLPEDVEDLIIFHTILAKETLFSGEKLYKVLENAGLSYGEMNVFHYPGDEKPDTFALFSVANIVEPGTFDLDEAQSLKTPGISLFLRLPTSIGNFHAYEKFLRVANVIATELEGELCDETRSKLTQQAIGHKKELIKKLNFELAKAQKLAEMNR